MVLAGSLALVVFYKCSVLLLLGLLRPHVPPMYDDDDALKSMAFTAQISYSHEKQFRVIPIIIIIIIICVVVDLILVSSCRMYEKNIYREFISFLPEPWFGLGIGGNQEGGGAGRQEEEDRHQTPQQRFVETTPPPTFRLVGRCRGEIRAEWSSRIKSDVKRRRRDLQKKNPSTLRLTDCVSSLEGDASVVGRAD